MPSKKNDKPKIEEVDTSKSNPTHGGNDPVTVKAAEGEKVKETKEHSSAYQSEHFTLRFEGNKAQIAPVSWVGPAPLVVNVDRLAELRDLLSKGL